MDAVTTWDHRRASRTHELSGSAANRRRHAIAFAVLSVRELVAGVGYCAR